MLSVSGGGLPFLLTLYPLPPSEQTMSAIHKAISANSLAVITGGASASGIGLAAAKALYQQGMNIAIGDVSGDLDQAVSKIKEGTAPKADNKVWAGSVDVGDVKSVESFRDSVKE
jgi:NAD(P)-dependent dehydrogenase (short-subunit alcohol dehydrogenase family)